MKTPSEKVKANILNLHNFRVWRWRQPRVGVGDVSLVQVWGCEVRMGCSCLAAGGRLEEIMRLPCTALGQYTVVITTAALRLRNIGTVFPRKLIHMNNMFSISTSNNVRKNIFNWIHTVFSSLSLTFKSHLFPSASLYSFLHQFMHSRGHTWYCKVGSMNPVCWCGWYIACGAARY